MYGWHSPRPRFFENILGLSINVSKTKMIWIGSKKKSKEILGKFVRPG